MVNYLIHFKEIDWECPAVGVQQKIYTHGNKRLRLLRFDDQFIENHWCTNEHIGFVLDGEMTIDFNGNIKKYKKGDGLWIEGGNASKHKAIIESNKFVELILFETV